MRPEDLLEVAAGARESWDVVPYATFDLPGLPTDGTATIAGAAYDPMSGRLFLTERFGESPRVHVLSIDASPAAEQPK